MYLIRNDLVLLSCMTLILYRFHQPANIKKIGRITITIKSYPVYALVFGRLSRSRLCVIPILDIKLIAPIIPVLETK